MTPSLPNCCAPRAFRLLAEQVPVLDSTDALLNGALAISMHQIEEVDPQRVDQTIQEYADRVRRRFRGSQPQAAVAHLHSFLFEEQGFLGNTNDYYAAENSYLPLVLKTRQGMPISLSLLYKLVAERIGLRAWGVGLPGHFVVGVEGDARRHDAAEPMLVDPFEGGRVLTVDEAHHRVRQLFGPEVEWSEAFLTPVSHRNWLTRMLQNLLRVFGGVGRYADVAAVLEMEMVLWPEQDHLQRDLGLVLARLGMARPASNWLDMYLQRNPDDPQREDLKQLRDVLLT